MNIFTNKLTYSLYITKIKMIEYAKYMKCIEIYCNKINI